MTQATEPFHKRINDILNKKPKNEHTFAEVLGIMKFSEAYNVNNATTTNITEEELQTAIMLVGVIAEKCPQSYSDTNNLVRLILELFPFFAHQFKADIHEQVKTSIVWLFKMFYSCDLERFRVAFEELIQMLKGIVNSIHIH